MTECSPRTIAVKNYTKPYKRSLALIVIITIGFSLRVIGANWGFPFLLHEVENAIAPVPAEMAERSSLDPNRYEHPDHVVIYLNAVTYHTVSAVVFGRPLVETFASNKTFYYLISRTISALLGALCIIVAYLIGKEYREDVGVIAALIVAIFPSYIAHSHFTSPDMPLTLLILLVILYAIKYLKNPTWQNLLRASLFSALATGIKYPGLLSALLVGTVVVQTHYRDRKKMLLVLLQAGLAFLVCAFAFSPYLFINYHSVHEKLINEARLTHLGADGLGWLGNLFYYVRSYLSFSGILMSVFFVIGTIFIIKKEKQYSIPVFFGLLFWMLLSKLPLHWERWALPMYVSPLLISAYGISTIHDKIKVKGNTGLTILFDGAVIFSLVNMMIISSAITMSFTLKDTRYTSYEFAKQNDISEQNTLFEGYTPFNTTYYGDISHDFDRVANNYRYVILSSFMYDRWLKEKERYKTQNEFYEKAFSLQLVKKFTPVPRFMDGMDLWEPKNIPVVLKFFSAYLRRDNGLFVGPTIEIFRLASGTNPAPLQQVTDSR